MYHMHARTWWELTLQSMVQERGSEGGQVEDPSKVHPVNKAGIQRAKARNAGALTGHQTGCPAPACIDWTSVPLISLTSYIENMASKGKKGSVSQEAGQQQKKMIEIKNMIQEAFRRIDPDYQIDEQLLKDTGVRSRRGEHVINNDVLKFHTKILTERGIQRDVQCPLKRSIQNDIMYEMVAEFEPYELYINVNAVIYGFYCGVLRIALLMLLEPTSQMKSNPLPAVQNWRIQMLRRTEEVNWRDEADCIITNMNACQAYVDPFAKVKWTGNSHANLTKCSGHVPRHTWTWLLWEIVSFCLDG
ncbi:uncharacterized protein LOC114786902 isoform X1 [Denticeps clupeoides]|uniref:uncharacterized protein LOC114786902 isoform X1 n=1 Tax=Denticeps clupeoides TaxID=299321 RepID=UPI0010A2BE61|nr:uncharacterized protein LOC114786902 isoform X1 [Denticeps clupeoides]XP_028830312.1 uncharacterized protein LOC114786902 isoform X1 [Denticeps clupeoides]